MKKFSTPCRSECSRIRGNRPANRQTGPGQMALNFIRQFARTYQAAPASLAATLPGFSLN